MVMRTIELTDGGVLLYDEFFLPAELADRYFVTIRDSCAWDQKPGIFGHMQPRLTASYGDESVTYRYSGTANATMGNRSHANGRASGSVGRICNFKFRWFFLKLFN